ncbi:MULTISPECIES: hypothetical protein [unclassified Nostoc]|uniref:hypothetical protein n=1 Tax=unclassified Nostoc TaxID=2593658 RepID=UPI00114D0E50|nr:hypothetical protein [Nostoc sp. KVJ20]
MSPVPIRLETPQVLRTFRDSDISAFLADDYHKDAINRRLYNNRSFVETAIHRVFCLNRTVLKLKGH